MAYLEGDNSERFAELVLILMRDEAARLGGVFAIEHHQRGNISEEITASVRRGDQTFRIEMQYVRKDAIRDHYLPAGWAHIENDWELRLRPAPEHPANGQFHWYRERREQPADSFSPPALVDENWLRELIRQKLRDGSV